MKKGQYTNRFNDSQFFKKILGILFAVAHDFDITAVELDVMSEHMALEDEIRFTHKGCQKVFDKTKRSIANQKNVLSSLASKRVLIKTSKWPLTYQPVPKFNISKEDINLSITLMYGQN